jgi:hypothetical protein
LNKWKLLIRTFFDSWHIYLLALVYIILLFG